jgi:hypothetical protein
MAWYCPSSFTESIARCTIPTAFWAINTVIFRRNSARSGSAAALSFAMRKIQEKTKSAPAPDALWSFDFLIVIFRIAF